MVAWYGGKRQVNIGNGRIIGKKSIASWNLFLAPMFVSNYQQFDALQASPVMVCPLQSSWVTYRFPVFTSHPTTCTRPHSRMLMHPAKQVAKLAPCADPREMLIQAHANHPTTHRCRFDTSSIECVMVRVLRRRAHYLKVLKTHKQVKRIVFYVFFCGKVFTLKSPVAVLIKTIKNVIRILRFVCVWKTQTRCSINSLMIKTK